MLSSKLVRSIEDHWETISARVVHAIRRDPKLPHVASLSDDDLRERSRDLLSRLGHWLVASKEEEVAEHFGQIGRRRYEAGVPLCEVAHTYQIVKHHAIQFVRDQGFHQNVIEMYSEEELEHTVNLFFDAILYYMIKGYEDSATDHPAARERHGQSSSPRDARSMARYM
jgi:hypothetical protein